MIRVVEVTVCAHGLGCAWSASSHDSRNLAGRPLAMTVFPPSAMQQLLQMHIAVSSQATLTQHGAIFSQYSSLLAASRLSSGSAYNSWQLGHSRHGSALPTSTAFVFPLPSASQEPDIGKRARSLELAIRKLPQDCRPHW